MRTPERRRSRSGSATGNSTLPGARTGPSPHRGGDAPSRGTSAPGAAGHRSRLAAREKPEFGEGIDVGPTRRLDSPGSLESRSALKGDSPRRRDADVKAAIGQRCWIKGWPGIQVGGHGGGRGERPRRAPPPGRKPSARVCANHSPEPAVRARCRLPSQSWAVRPRRRSTGPAQA